MSDDLELLARRAARDDLKAARRLVAILEERRGFHASPPGVMQIAKELADALATHLDPEDLEEWVLEQNTPGRRRASAKIEQAARDGFQSAMNTTYAVHVAGQLLSDDPVADSYMKSQLSRDMRITCTSSVPVLRIEREVRRLLRNRS